MELNYAMKKEYLLIIAGILYGGIIFGGKIFANLGLSIYEISILPLFFSTILVPWIIINKKFRFSKQQIIICFKLGLFGAIIYLSQFGAVVLGMPVALIVLLLYTQPIWTSILSKLLLNEKIGKIKIIAVAVSIIGILVIINPFSLKNTATFLGTTLSLIAGIFISGWVVQTRKVGIEKYDIISTVFLYLISMLILLLISWPIVTFFISDPGVTKISFAYSAKIWFGLFVFAIVTMLIPLVLHFTGIREVHASSAGIYILLEIPTAAILSIIFLHESLNYNIIIGGVLIVYSNYILLKEIN